MRIVAIEEHFTIPSLIGRIGAERAAKRGFLSESDLSPVMQARSAALRELGQVRFDDMDAAGISMQVLSLSGPGSDLLPPEEGPAWAREANDILYASTSAHPGRYAGFAHLPMTTPEEAAKELERTITKLGFCGGMVNGTCEGKFLDDPCYDSLLSAAEALDVPIYVHPGIPPEPVAQAYYGGFSDQIKYLFSTAGWGWHTETAVHVLRLVLSGALDKHPRLKLIIGHMGEGLQTMLERCDDVLNGASKTYLQRGVSETIRDQVWITTSGIFSTSSFLAALMSFGVDRLIFSVDYPFSTNATGRKFLDTIPVSPGDKIKIAHANADAVLKLNP